MYSHEYTYRVTYADTDMMGYMYYGNYARLYEIGRVELIRSLGITYQSMEREMGIMLPVVSVESRYLKPALYDDILTVTTSLTEMPDKLITFYFIIKNGNNEIIHKAEVKLFFVEMSSGKRISCPALIADNLKSWF